MCHICDMTLRDSSLVGCLVSLLHDVYQPSATDHYKLLHVDIVAAILETQRGHFGHFGLLAVTHGGLSNFNAQFPGLMHVLSAKEAL